MSEEQNEKMSESAKTMMAVIGAILVGFILVWSSKQQTNEEKENAAMVRGYYNLVTMASDLCPKALKKDANVQVYSHKSIDTDKENYMTLNYEAEDGEKSGFKTAHCKIETAKGGITELVVDGKSLIKR